MKAFLFTLLFFTSLTAQGEIRHWDFRVFLGEREVGTHRFTLTESGAISELRSVARLGAERWRLAAPGIQIELQYAQGEWTALEALKEGRRLRYALETGR